MEGAQDMNIRPILVFAVASLTAPLFSDGTRVLRTEFQDVPPKYIVENGISSGFSYEILKTVEAKSGYTFEYVSKLVPLARVSKNLEVGEMDIQFGLQKTPEREKAMVFGPALYKVTIIGVMRKDDADTIEHISDLVKRKDIALTQFGTGAAAGLKGIPGLIVDDGAKDVEANIQKLLAKRGKIIIYHNLTLNWVIASSKLKDKLRIVDLDFEDDPDFVEVYQYLVYSKKVPQNVMNDINRAVQEVIDSGELQTITDKYLK
jgi:ABC-type amino acid transport substrate-binding protein